MNISNGSLGFIGRMVVLIGLSAGLAACGDDATTASAGAGAAAVSGSTAPKSGTTSTPTNAGSTTVPVSTGTTSPAGTSSPAGTTPTGTPAPTAKAESITLSWAAPTENTDGSALTNLSGFDIYYGTSSAALTQKININSVGLLTYVVENLSSGTWFFEVVAVNAAGVQSGPSSVVSVTI
jgi:hypothetical protein